MSSVPKSAFISDSSTSYQTCVRPQRRFTHYATVQPTLSPCVTHDGLLLSNPLSCFPTLRFPPLCLTGQPHHPPFYPRLVRPSNPKTLRVVIPPLRHDLIMQFKTRANSLPTPGPGKPPYPWRNTQGTPSHFPFSSHVFVGQEETVS